MKATNVALLFYTASVVEATTATTRLEFLHHRHQRRLFQSNGTLKNVQDGFWPTGNTAIEATVPVRTATAYINISVSQAVGAPTTKYNATERPFPYSTSPLISALPSTAPITGAEVNDINGIHLPPPAESIHKTGEPNLLSTPIHGLFTNSSATARGNADASGYSSALPTTGGRFPANSSSPITTSSIEPCTPLPSDRAVTEYSIIYTSTITFYGNSTDYTPPYSPMKTPNFCSPTGEALITFYSTTHVSNSTAIEKGAPLTTASPTVDIGIPALVAPIPAITFSFDLPEILTPTPGATGGDEDGDDITITIKPYRSFTRRIITFITTDKNPAVVFSPEPTPDFSPTWITGGIGNGVHRTMDVIDTPPTDTSISNNLVESVKRPPVPTFQVTAGGDQVIINEKTISGLKPSQTITITVGNDVFTIFPTAVVGFGSTVTKPAPQEISLPTSAIASGVLGGVSVIIAGTNAVVDGTTLSISPQMATTTINGHKVALGTGTIAVGHETLVFQNPSPRPTHEIITGGEMITAIGKSIVVLHSTTITYGAKIAPKETTINGATLSIGPRGISFHGTTLGGPSANSTNTEYEIVGGVTVGKLLPSLVVVNGATYSINKDGDLKNLETTIIDNQTITIGPSGLILSSQTLTYPGSSVTATLSPSMPDRPAVTASRDGDEESSAFAIRQQLSFLYICLVVVSVLVII